MCTRYVCACIAVSVYPSSHLQMKSSNLHSVAVKRSGGDQGVNRQKQNKHIHDRYKLLKESLHLTYKLLCMKKGASYRVLQKTPT